MSELTSADNVQTLANAATSKLPEIDQDGHLDELWTRLKAPITSISLEKLDKGKRNRKDWMAAETLNQYPNVRDARVHTPLSSAKNDRKRH